MSVQPNVSFVTGGSPQRSAPVRTSYMDRLTSARLALGGRPRSRRPTASGVVGLVGHVEDQEASHGRLTRGDLQRLAVVRA